MNERLFATLADWLAHEPVVLASLTACDGATPRNPGARMLIAHERCVYSIGGGMAEVQVIAAARTLLVAGEQARTLDIDLRGGPDSAGVCGGRMRLHLRRWHGAGDEIEAKRLGECLAAGNTVELEAERGGIGEREMLQPDPRLLIIGGGHCGLALAQMAAMLDFERWLYDDRADLDLDCPGATCLRGEPERLDAALGSERKVYAVLLNRDWQRDLACLRVLARQPPHWIGMMGSRRRIAQVRAALALHELPITAPVGLDIGAQTPHEIAVSILAQLVALRHGVQGAA